MQWVCEEVLPREVRKLTAVVEEKDMQIALLDDDLIDDLAESCKASLSTPTPECRVRFARRTKK